MNLLYKAVGSVMCAQSARGKTSLSDLPDDELAIYASELGLSVPAEAARGELLRVIRARQELLIGLDREALLDVVVWARRPVRRSAGKEHLAREIATIRVSRFDGLSDRGLRALAQLHGLDVRKDESYAALAARLGKQHGFWASLDRKRRAVVGSLVSRLLEGAKTEGPRDYRFLPEHEGRESLKQSIQEVGVVDGIAKKLRGAADQFIEQKLNEIERRIDSKLDEIDLRLAEWRDQEVKNRFKIIKLTLISAIVVACISLGYDYVKNGSGLSDASSVPTASVEREAD